jgi:hypothetical protein
VSGMQEDPGEPGVTDAWVTDEADPYIVLCDEMQLFIVDPESPEGEALLAEQHRRVMARMQRIIAGGRHG